MPGSGSGDSIVVCKSGRGYRIRPGDPSFDPIKHEIESIATSSDDSYKFIMEQKRLETLRKRGFFVELTYAVPRESTVEYLRKYFNVASIRITSILIPLDQAYLPAEAVLVMTTDRTYVFANMRHSKVQLREYVDRLL